MTTKPTVGVLLAALAFARHALALNGIATSGDAGTQVYNPLNATFNVASVEFGLPKHSGSAAVRDGSGLWYITGVPRRGSLDS